MYDVTSCLVVCSFQGNIFCRFIYRLLLIVPSSQLSSPPPPKKYASISSNEKLTVADAGFLKVEGTSKVGAGCQRTYYLATNLFENRMIIEEIVPRGRLPGAPFHGYDYGLCLFSSSISTMYTSRDNQLLFRLKDITTAGFIVSRLMALMSSSVNTLQ